MVPDKVDKFQDTKIYVGYEDNLDSNVLDEMVYVHATIQGENFKGH